MLRAICATLILIVLFSSSCNKGDAIQPVCGEEAIVRDLRDLDGCGFVFELRDGTRLHPTRIGYCSTPPAPERPQDPLDSFEFADGKKVKISYTIKSDWANACMSATTVIITCLTEENKSETEL